MQEFARLWTRLRMEINEHEKTSKGMAKDGRNCKELWVASFSLHAKQSLLPSWDQQAGGEANHPFRSLQRIAKTNWRTSMFWKNIMTIASAPTDGSCLLSQYMHLLPRTHTCPQDILSRIHWRDHIWACQITCKVTERNEKRVPGAFVRDAMVHQSYSMFVMCFERLWWSLGTLMAPYSPYFQMCFLYVVRTRIVSLAAVQQPLYASGSL